MISIMRRPCSTPISLSSIPAGRGPGGYRRCLSIGRSEIDPEPADHAVDVALQVAEHQAVAMEILDADIGEWHRVPDQVELAGDQLLVEAAPAGTGEPGRVPGADKAERRIPHVADVVVQDAGADVG